MSSVYYSREKQLLEGNAYIEFNSFMNIIISEFASYYYEKDFRALKIFE